MPDQKPLLIGFLGSIGVGKSYFARQLAPKIEAVRLSADAARLAMFGSLEEIESRRDLSGEEDNNRLFGAIDYTVHQILKSGKSVVYDTARFNGAANRDKLSNIANETGVQLVYVWIETPREVAAIRVRERDEMEDQRKLTKEAADRIFSFHDEHFDAPREGEAIIKIDGTIPFEDQFESFQKQLSEL